MKDIFKQEINSSQLAFKLSKSPTSKIRVKISKTEADYFYGHFWSLIDGIDFVLESAANKVHLLSPIQNNVMKILNIEKSYVLIIMY